MATYIEASPVAHAADRPVMTRAVNVLRAVADWRRRSREKSIRRRNLRNMRTLNDHVLRDIGLHRSELASVVYNSQSERRRSYDPR